MTAPVLAPSPGCRAARRPRARNDENGGAMDATSGAGSFVAAATLLSAADRALDDLWTPFLGPTGTEGAVVTTLGDPMGTQTVGATDDIAARIDEIQIDLGEGPCWEALRRRRPVLTADVGGGRETEWPTARSAFQELDIGALFSFPMYVGKVGIGSIDLYSRRTGDMPDGTVRGAELLAAVVARKLMRRALRNVGAASEGIPDGPYSRREMHQATGMVAAQLSMDVDDALLVLRGHAFATGRSVLDVAADVVARRLAFDA